MGYEREGIVSKKRGGDYTAIYYIITVGSLRILYTIGGGGDEGVRSFFAAFVLLC